PGRSANFAHEPVDADALGELGVQNLDSDFSVVLEIERDIDSRHPAAPDLVFGAVAILERVAQLVKQIHSTAAEERTSFEASMGRKANPDRRYSSLLTVRTAPG